MTRTLAANRRELSLALILVMMILTVCLRFPAFGAPENLRDVFNDSSILIILALGQLAVIVAGGVDLSAASTLALSGMAASLFSQRYPELGAAPAITVAVAVGVVAGAGNGLLVKALKVPPIVATLATLALYRGLVFVASGGAYANRMAADYTALVGLRLLGLPLLSWIALAVIVAVAVFLRFTRAGRGLFAAGGNPQAAAYAGLDPASAQALAYVISGGLAGLGGYLWTARLGVADAAIAQGFELQVIAACVIGGVAITGGTGKVLGAVMGALFLGVINNALPLIGASPFWQMAISGLVILIAVSANSTAFAEPRRRILAETGQ